MPMLDFRVTGSAASQPEPSNGPDKLLLGPDQTNVERVAGDALGRPVVLGAFSRAGWCS